MLGVGIGLGLNTNIDSCELLLMDFMQYFLRLDYLDDK